jgi:chromosome segregation ATPase
MSDMSDENVMKLQQDVAVLQSEVDNLKETRFAVLEAKLDAVRSVLEAKIDAQGQRMDGLSERIDVQGQRINGLGERMDRLETGLMSFRVEVREDLRGVRNWLTGVLVIVGGVIGVIQFLTQ